MMGLSVVHCICSVILFKPRFSSALLTLDGNCDNGVFVRLLKKSQRCLKLFRTQVTNVKLSVSVI